VIKERDVGASETEGDTAAHFMADISFNYYPQTAVKFTDFPYHKANTIEGDHNEADALVSSAWDHKNIALLEPASTCGPEQGDQAWGISVFKVEEHRSCITDGETAWEGHPCVHYSGYISAATSNFVNVNEGRFVCQLFVDSAVERSTVDGGGGAWETDSRTACDPCVEAQAVKDGKEECCLMIGYKCYTGFWSNDDDLCCSGECGLEWSGEYRCQPVKGQKDRRGDTVNSVGYIGGRRKEHGGLNEEQKKCHLCVAGRAQYDDPDSGQPLYCGTNSVPY